MKTIASYSTFQTALGLFSAATHTSGAVLATAFGDVDELRNRIPGTEFVQDDGSTAVVRSQISDYLAGRRVGFDLDLAPVGSEFQQRVWAELQKIPRGQTRTYGDLARELGSSPRAVGRANATNPICLIVPCHRVIGANGALTGFAFGERIKEQLLTLEGACGFHTALFA